MRTIDGLCEKIVGSGLQGAHFLFVVVQVGGDDDGDRLQLLVVLQRAAYLVAVCARELEVQDDRLRGGSLARAV